MKFSESACKGIKDFLGWMEIIFLFVLFPVLYMKINIQGIKIIQSLSQKTNMHTLWEIIFPESFF